MKLHGWGTFQEVGEAQDIQVLESALVGFGHRLGFPMFSAAVVVDHPPESGGAVFYSIGNPPSGFEAARQNVENSRRDPVLKAMKGSNVPIVWDQRTYVKSGTADLWEEQAPFGYRGGVAVALHRADGRHFLLGYSRDEGLPSSERALGRLLADFQLLAVYAQDAAMRLLRPATPGPAEVRLSPREREVLEWTAAGKSAWVIGQILGLSPHTVVFYRRCAVEKLGCGTSREAVLRARERGLI